MRDGDIDDILKQAADAQPGVDPALLERVSRSIGAAGALLPPVRVLPPPRVLAAGLIAVCVAAVICTRRRRH